MNGPSQQSYPGLWHAVVDFLAASGVDTVFGLPADDVQLLRALDASASASVSASGAGTGTGSGSGPGSGVSMVLCRDQRNALFMATGHALASGRPAVCVVGKGPAAANAVTGLLEARYSAAPVLLLAAGTPAARRGAAAFQEADQMALVGSLVRWAHRVDHPERLAPALEKALAIATGPAPGPVYLELPDDLLEAEIVRRRPWAALPQTLRHTDPAHAGGDALEAIRRSRRPILLAGGGMRHRNADRVVERFAEQIGAAVFSTASGRGAVAEDHPLFCGLAGLYRRPETAGLWREADLVIAVGSRLEETATYGWDSLPPDTPVVQVNTDPADVSAEFAGPRVIGDAAGALAAWSGLLPQAPQDGAWREAVSRARRETTEAADRELRRMAASDRLHVAEVLAALTAALPADHVLVQENGLQDMWSYLFPYYSTGALGGSVVPSEQTSLGFGAAAAAGVKLAAPEKAVAAFVGDGAFGLFRSDLATVADAGAAVLYVVLHNGGYGWLQSQLDHLGEAAQRFSFVRDEPGIPEPGRLPGVYQHVVVDKGELASVLSTAVKECAAGRVSVVHVPVGLDDVPPGISEVSDAPIPQ
ncbi:thiamine pyrophosphate-binding protein [Streptomyces sp. NPDC051907]|uniref:thiamine pyrophosphate-binding protein n=1 Tax=Streptomyces sp. NPDC051907 TaxID=3155284 RepID=UPI00343B0F7E